MRALAVSLALLLTAPTLLADTGAEERARELYALGKADYASGDYASAIERFQQAYALSRAPALLFNLAQAYRLSEQCAAALSYYHRYLVAAPRADNRREVEERIEEMAGCLARTKQESPPPAAATAPSGAATATRSERDPDSDKTAPILVTGAGAALAVAGAVLYGAARHKYAEAERECPCYPDRYATWETATYVSYGLMALGAATAAAGATWWISASSDTSGRSAFVSVGAQF